MNIDERCLRCGSPFRKIYFIEDEYIVVNGVQVKTNRKRKACSHLECWCGNKITVDDSFDEPWK